MSDDWKEISGISLGRVRLAMTKEKKVPKNGHGSQDHEMG